MTNSAAATTLGIEHFHPIAVINQGTAGGHDPSLHSFDIVLGAKTFDASAWVSRVERRGADGRHIKLRPTYYYDSNLKEDKSGIELTADPELLDIRFLHEKYGSSCEEMETHAAAHICRVYDVPFIGIRIISNTEIHGENFNPATGTACQQYVLTVIKSYAERKIKETQSNAQK